MLPEPNHDLGKKTRRAVLKAAGAALGIASIGTAAGHPGDGGNQKFYGGTEGYLGDNIANASSDDIDLVGYHSGGGVGSASLSGQPEDAHKGAMSEFRIHDDLAFASIFSARGEHSQRGVAIFDIGAFTRADDPDEVRSENADLTLLSFVRNDNSQAACMDVKVSDDGNYIFVCKQTVTALFGEATGSRPNTDNSGTSAGAGSLLVVDVSDPGNPEVTDEVYQSHWSVGPHNGWYHQIGGEEYFFTVHGTSGAASKVNTFQFDRASGQLQQVNAWSWDTNLSQADYGADSNEWYHHDINIQEDPETGRPLAYLHCWDAGLRIFDVSDPLNVQEIGVFEQYGAHHAVPAPALVEINGEEKRVAVTGHENPDSSYHPHIEGNETGRYNLVDCDPLDKALNPDSDIEKVYLGCASSIRNNPDEEPLARVPYQMYDVEDSSVETLAGRSELDSWTLIGEGEGWDAAPGFEKEARMANENPDPENEEEGPGEYDGFANFRLSAHNIDMDTRGNLYAGHYHAGARFFDTTSGTIEPTGYFRDGKEIDADRALANDTPEQSPVSIDGLTGSTPFFWNAVERNGLVFAGGINGGPHVMLKDGAPVGSDKPVDVDIERDHDSSVVTAGQTHRVTIRAEADEEVVLRDAVPSEWTVFTDYSPNPVETHEIEDYRTIVNVELEEVEDGVYEGTYVVSAPENEEGNNLGNTGSYTFGPVEYARTDGNGNADVDSDFGGGNSTTNRLWRKENGAVTSINVVGIDTSL